ncbi:MAG TPA: hypothetical protein PKX52_09190 [Methanomassiliicoccaceae archaeon]|nr:hypothetical protein [Methanomassiliicoccaceae archaeon]
MKYSTGSTIDIGTGTSTQAEGHDQVDVRTDAEDRYGGLLTAVGRRSMW